MTRCTAHCAYSALSSGIALALVLGGCRNAPTVAPSPPAADRDTVTWVFPVGAHRNLPELSVEVFGEDKGPGARVSIRKMAVRTGSTGGTVQILEGFDAQPSRSALDSGVAFQVLDMNFDGYRDIRLLEVAPAGPNVRYLNWLYRPESATFVPSAALDALIAPRFDAETREVISTRREDPSRHVSETYLHSGDGLVLKRRAVREYSEPGRYTLTVSEPHDQGMRIVDRRVVDEEQP